MNSEHIPGFIIETFTASKDLNLPENNEDAYSISQNTIVLSDGASSKGDKINFNGITGGKVAADIVIHTCETSTQIGYKLVNAANQALKKFYFSTGIDQSTAFNRIAASLLCVRKVEENLVITQVNNTGFRVNASTLYLPETLCDKLHSSARSDYIKTTKDIKGSRDYILPLLERQLLYYQNNSSHPLGYGVIDGTKTPKKFIGVYTIPISEINTLELFTDGYPLIPKGSSINNWEEAFEEVQANDPDRYLKYPSTKSSDDRTLIIIKRIKE